jgi:hypothetical protein
VSPQKTMNFIGIVTRELVTRQLTLTFALLTGQKTHHRCTGSDCHTTHFFILWGLFRQLQCCLFAFLGFIKSTTIRTAPPQERILKSDHKF